MTSLGLVYVPLLGEGTDVWVPVAAEPFGDGFYRLAGAQPPDQFWRFPAGYIVGVAHRAFGADGDGWVATESFGACPPSSVELCDVRSAPTGGRRLCIFRRQDGLFQYREDHLFDDDDFGLIWREGYPLSGLFGSLARAAADAPSEYR
jgi:hypothetical protein